MTRSIVVVLAILHSLPPAAAGATVPVDGRLEPVYGAARCTQTTQTSYFDNTQGEGSELDAAYGFISDGVVHLFVAGNLGFCCATHFANQEELDLFIDSKPGGQNVLRSDNALLSFGSRPGGLLNSLAGLTFDGGFAPDYWLSSMGGTMSTWYAELLTSGGGTGDFLGRMNGSTFTGPLSGGTNTIGVQVGLENSNLAGVTAGCGAASGAGVTTGFEWAIPLAAIGDPSGCVEVNLMLLRAETGQIGNQVLGPLPPGSCAIGAPATADLNLFEGAQHFTVCPSALGVAPSTTRTSLSAPRPNPCFREASFRLDLARDMEVDVSVFDLIGRRRDTLYRGLLTAGSHDLVWRALNGSGLAIAPGLYLIEARVGSERFTRRALVIQGN